MARLRCPGIYLDTNTDWDAVAERLRDGYRLIAPKTLLAALEAASRPVPLPRAR